jgi:hypothetical protein
MIDDDRRTLVIAQHTLCLVGQGEDGPASHNSWLSYLN